MKRLDRSGYHAVRISRFQRKIRDQEIVSMQKPEACSAWRTSHVHKGADRVIPRVLGSKSNIELREVHMNRSPEYH